jgi:hypothetical protein
MQKLVLQSQIEPFRARNQIADYYVGKNGLASHAADDTPAAYRAPFTWWENYTAD